MQAQDMRISRRYTVSNWKELKFTNQDDWRRAVEIFKDRIETRFLDYVQLIEEHEGSGFAVLALDCLLIETLQQFFEGKKDSRGESKESFVKFLTKTSFSQHFDKSKAILFYECIRCGILHQAEAIGNSRIRMSIDVPLVALPQDNTYGLIVNRRLFHEQLLNVYTEYISKILKGGKENEQLRCNFKKKMNYICRLSGIQ